ncbi:hypothetical protein ACS0TY_014917 [Phlomoides rotata]
MDYALSIPIGSANSGVLPAPGVQELNVTRLLTLSEKAVAVAHAVSLDNDYSPDVEAGEISHMKPWERCKEMKHACRVFRLLSFVEVG